MTHQEKIDFVKEQWRLNPKKSLAVRRCRECKRKLEGEGKEYRDLPPEFEGKCPFCGEELVYLRCTI